jgi:rRNA-processing protein FCF1
VGAAGLDRWFPEYILVVEGQAKAAVPALREVAGIRVVAAPGSGDDTIAGLAATAGGRRLVVTADRELRGRSANAGAAVTGPRWLLGLL